MKRPRTVEELRNGHRGGGERRVAVARRKALTPRRE